MVRVLVVEDSDRWQMLHRNRLEAVLGEGNVDIVDNYNDAICMLGGNYAAYIIDGQFPKYRGEDPQLLGIQLAQEIGQRGGSYDKIAMVSTGNDMLAKARELGITKTYKKGFPNEGEKKVVDLVQDLQPLFNIGRRYAFDTTLVKMYQTKTLTHSLLVVLYDNIPQYCTPMPLNPEPDINIPVYDFPSIYRNALMLNKCIEDGAVMLKLPEKIGEDPILTGWSYRLFAPPLNVDRKENRGSAYNSLLDFSGVNGVQSVYLVNKREVLRFENGTETILYSKNF